MIFYDLRHEATERTIGDIAAREQELSRLGRTVHRMYHNNVLVSGMPGVGKTALLEGFAYRVAKKRIPGLDDYRLIKLESTDIARMSASSESSRQLLEGIQSLPAQTILFIDDAQRAFDGGQNHKSAGFAGLVENVITIAAERADVAVVLSVSENGLRQLSTEHPNLLKHFEHITLNAPDEQQTTEILTELAPSFAKEYGIEIPEQVAVEIATLSQKLLSTQQQPLRAIHFLDECLAYAKMHVTENSTLSVSDARAVFSESTGIPSETLQTSDSDFLKTLEPKLRDHVIGQDHAVHVVADVVKRSRMGLRNPKRPYGSFLFLGTSGVGKTELAKVLAQTVYGSERLFTRIDMSEFGESHTVQRLIGAPPGYIGFESGGQLTNAVQEHPYSLILLDEIEKANPKIFDIFLQVFDDGRLTDGRGHTAQFTNSILIATSNVGVAEIITATQNGQEVSSDQFISDVMMPVLLQRFRPEFLNRFDAIVVFNPLSADDLLRIAQLEIRNIEARTAEHDIHFDIDPAILRAKIEEISDPLLGARPIKRFVEQTCERLIAMKLTEGA